VADDEPLVGGGEDDVGREREARQPQRGARVPATFASRATEAPSHADAADWYGRSRTCRQPCLHRLQAMRWRAVAT
jgi:hypothetical protein